MKILTAPAEPQDDEDGQAAFMPDTTTEEARVHCIFQVPIKNTADSLIETMKKRDFPPYFKENEVFKRKIARFFDRNVEDSPVYQVMTIVV